MLEGVEGGAGIPAAEAGGEAQMTNTATTPNKAPVRSDYERDDYESQVLEATLDRSEERRVGKECA